MGGVRLCVKNVKGTCVRCWGSLAGSPQSGGTRKKSRPQHRTKSASISRHTGGVRGCVANPDPLPASGRQKIEHPFVFKLFFYFSFLQIHTECKEGRREQGASGRAGAQRGQWSSSVGPWGSLRCFYWEGGLMGAGEQHVSPDPQTTKDSVKEGSLQNSNILQRPYS